MSAGYYVEELQTKTSQNNSAMLILLLVSIATLFLAMAILFPVLKNVNQARMTILSLFVDIPNHHSISLGDKCEKYLMSLHEEQNEEMEIEEEGSIKA
jgi:hypothetical protein